MCYLSIRHLDLPSRVHVNHNCMACWEGSQCLGVYQTPSVQQRLITAMFCVHKGLNKATLYNKALVLGKASVYINALSSKVSVYIKALVCGDAKVYGS